MNIKAWMKGHWWQLSLTVLGLLYISNLGAGVIEFIPDNLPIFGNLDEAAVGAGLGFLAKKLM